MINPRDWYCFVGDDDTRVWSSATNTYVPADDPVSMSKKGADCPGRIGSEAELWEVMRTNAPGFLPEWLFDGRMFSLTSEGVYNPGQLKRYSASFRLGKENGGMVSSSGFPTRTDESAQVRIIGLYLLALQNPSLTVRWEAADGVIYRLSAPEIAALKEDVLNHINNCFEASADVIAGIDGGTITTLHQINAAFGEG